MRKLSFVKIILKPLFILSLAFSMLTLQTSPTYAVPSTATNPNDSQNDNNNALQDVIHNSEVQNPNTSNSNTEDTNSNNTDNTTEDEESTEEEINTCKDQVGVLSWIICPSGALSAAATDTIYNITEDFLQINPLTSDQESPVYVVWQYARNISNIVFIIFIAIAIFSQLTGFGINNYGIKRILPRIIMAAILVNLSYVICTLAVDLSNVIGASLRGLFENLQNDIIARSNLEGVADFTIGNVLGAAITGGTILGVVISATGGGISLMFALIPIAFSALLAVLTGLLTVAARQAFVFVLVMIAPLPFVAYLFPNTEKYFGKWRDMLVRMLVFYPLFSFLFGASSVVAIVVATTTDNPLIIILGIAIKYIPFFAAWPLMKFSGTPLAAISSAVDKATNPAKRGLSGWSMSHANKRREVHLGYSNMPGAKLRRFLDQRKFEREYDTEQSARHRKNLAAERTLKRIASVSQPDAEGNDQWRKKPRSITERAKMASISDTKTATAQEALANTLSAYGTHFSHKKGDRAGKLGDEHGEAYIEAMKQKFTTVNQAQADQQFLLDQYLKAAKTMDSSDPSAYNRLIKSASADLGHLGEAAIMGQVIKTSSEIESRRRTEARIIFTKFPHLKTDFRAMTFDCAAINDNGFEIDPNTGQQVEDEHYNLLPGMHHTPWQHYIGVHKETGTEINKEQYDALGEKERQQYRKVKYMNITDDKSGKVQRIYDDDAGYMKELLADDIAIGDPINQRYNFSIGNARPKEEQQAILNRFGLDPNDLEDDGILRRYHSTTSRAMMDSKFKEHDAGVSPMTWAQTNMGYVNTPGQWLIATMQSIDKAAKPGAILTNDKFFVEQWQKVFQSLNSTEPGKTFSDYITDKDIALYQNVNGAPLDGLRLITDENGNQKWTEISHNDPSLTIDDLRNTVKHKLMPKVAAKLASAFNRKVSPNIADSQKKDGLLALRELAMYLSQEGARNNNDSIPFEDRLNPNIDIFEGKDPEILRTIMQYGEVLSQLTKIESKEPLTSDSLTQSEHAAVSELQERLRLLERRLEIDRNDSDITTINQNIRDLYATSNMTMDRFCQNIHDYYDDNQHLRTHLEDVDQILERYMNGTAPDSDNFYDLQASTGGSIEELCDELCRFNEDHYY